MKLRGLITHSSARNIYRRSLGFRAWLVLIFACSHTIILKSQTTFTWDSGPTNDLINPVSTVVSSADGKSLQLVSKIAIGVYHSSFFAPPKSGTAGIFILGYTADTLVITVDADGDSIYGDPFSLNSILIGEFGTGTSTLISLLPNGDESEKENHLDDNGSSYQTYSPANPANFTNITSLEIINGNASGAHFIVDNITATVPDINTTPTAANNTLTTNEDARLTISTSDLGYSDGDGDVLSHIFLVEIPTSGTLFLDADGDDQYDVGEELSQTDLVSKSDLDSDKLIFQPDADESGVSYSAFEFVVHDGKSYAESSHSITFNVNSINDEPSFDLGADVVVGEDAGAQGISSWATSIDKGAAEESAQTLTFTLSNDNNSLFSVQPAIDANGTLTYTPAEDAHGIATISVVLSDDGGTANGGDDTYDTQTFSITVNSVNDEPSFTKGADEQVLEDAGPQMVNSWATSLDKGAFNEATQTLTFTLSNDNNSLFSVQPTIDANGNLSYTPAPNANGVAMVDVVLSDDGGTSHGGDDTYDTQTFSITVDAVNDEPSFSKGADQSILEDAVPQIVNAWATSIHKGAANEGDQTLTFTLSNDNNSLFSVQPAIDSSGILTYSLAADAHGGATVSVVLSDDGDSLHGGDRTFDTQTFSITVNSVNDEPSFTKGADEHVLEDAGPQIVNAWATSLNKGAVNENGQALTFSLSNNNNALFSVQPAIDSSGTLTYTPVEGANGTAMVSVVLSDDGGTANGGDDTYDTQTFSISVIDVNNEPSFVKGADESILEDAGAQIVHTWASSLNKGAVHESDQTLTFSLSNDNSSLFSIQPAIDTSGTLTYTPAENAHGVANVSVILSDDGGTANGGDDTYDTQTFSIIVNAVNDEPSFSKGPDENVLEDAGPQIRSFWATSLNKGAANESSQSLTFSLSNDNPTLFSVQPAIDSSGTLTYTPAEGASGTAIVSAILSDDGGTVNGGDDSYAPQSFTISINSVNDEPSFVKGADESVLEDAGAQQVSTWATSLSKGGAHESNQTLIFSLSNDNPSLFSVQPTIDTSGTLRYTPAENAHGVATVSVILSDDGGTANGGDDTYDTQTFSIIVNAVNDEPSFIIGSDENILEDAGPQVLSSWATSLDKGAANESGQSLTFTLSNDNNSLFSVQPAIDNEGTLTYTTAEDANGIATVSVLLSDNGGTVNGGDDSYALQTFDITVNSVNDEPGFSLGTDETVLEDAGQQLVSSWASSISLGAIDESGQALTFTLSNDNPNLFSVQPAINSSGDLSYTLAADAFGRATVSVILSDDGGTANGGDDSSPPQNFSITVLGVNDKPTFTIGSDVEVPENAGPQLINNWASSLNKGALNESDQTLIFFLSNDNNGLFSGQPAIDSEGTLSFTPAPDANGEAIVSIVLSDDGGRTNGGDDSFGPQTFIISVFSVNTPPSFSLPTNPNQMVLEDAGIQVIRNYASQISPGGGSDEASQVLTFHITTSNDELFEELPSIDPLSGDLQYTPAENANGEATVTVWLADDGGGTNTSSEQSFTISISPVNDIPSFELPENPHQTVNEDAGPQIVDGFARSMSPGGGIDEADQSLRFYVYNSNDALFSVLPAVDVSTGDLTYTLAANANGSSIITLILADNGDGVNFSSLESFTVIVNPVNDAPEFVLPENPDQLINEDAGEQVVTSFLSSFHPGGGADERSQSLSFHISTDNDALFTKLPELSSTTGDLTYIPAPDANGSATISLRLQDNAGGEDISDEQSFVINVQPVNDKPTFTLAGNPPEITENDGPQTVLDFITNISPGGGVDEANQKLEWNIVQTSKQGDLSFERIPHIAPDGMLTYTPNDFTSGIADFRVTLSDEGTPSATSETHFFSINVATLNYPPTVQNPLLNRIFYVGFGSASIDLTEVFQDAEEDPLSFSVFSSDTNVVKVSIIDQTLTVTEVGRGLTEITISVDDGNGNTIEHRFAITVDFVLSHIPSIEERLHIFPNPTTDKATIQGLPPNIQAIWLSDILGRRMGSYGTLSNGVWIVDLGDLKKGVYFIHIKVQKQVISRKVIKR